MQRVVSLGSLGARARRASDILGVNPRAYTLAVPWSAMRQEARVMLWMAGDQAEIVTRPAVGLAGFSWKD